MNQVQKQAIERVREMARMTELGNYDEVVRCYDGTFEGAVVVDGERRQVFATSPEPFFDPAPVLEVHDQAEGPAARPGQLQQLERLRYPGPMPRTEEGATRLLDFWQTYYSVVVRQSLSPTQGQLQALKNFGYDGPAPATRDEAKRILAAIQAERRQAKKAA